MGSVIILCDDPIQDFAAPFPHFPLCSHIISPKTHHNITFYRLTLQLILLILVFLSCIDVLYFHYSYQSAFLAPLFPNSCLHLFPCLPK